MKLTAKSGRDNKIHIYIDGEYSLTADGEYWYTSRWCREKEIDEENFEELKTEVECRRAWLSALDLISVRSHSEQELIQKLRRKYSQDAAEAAAAKAAALGLIDDEAFAEMYARELIERKKYGVFRVKNELRKKGISSHIIESVLLSLDIDPKESIISLVERKYARRLSDEKGRRQTVAALQRLGYSYSDIRSALSEFDMSDDTYDEW